MEAAELEQLRVFIARQQAQLDQLQQQVQQQLVHQAQARQASPVSQDLSELRSIVDTRVMEKIPIFDGNEAHFAEWQFTFEATCGLQPEVSLKNKVVYYLLVASCRGRAQVLVRGVPKHAGLVVWRQMVHEVVVPPWPRIHKAASTTHLSCRKIRPLSSLSRSRRAATRDQTDITGLIGTSSGTASIGTGRASARTLRKHLGFPCSRLDGEGVALPVEVAATIFQGASP